ncbi:MAG: GAF domain-containing protein, partial [Candidatus Tectomicrobia bacterium]|nr:GAF domain-containing protein [Candidatus Tectomicrobia bacterium]
MRIFLSLLTSPRLFRWVGVGGVACSLLFPLVAGSTSIWIMKNVTAGSETRQLAAHLRAELAEHLVLEDLQPPLSPKAISALDYLFHRSSLSRAENLKAIRLWSAEEKLLWSSRSGAGGSVPPPEAFREALRQGFTFRQIPPNTWYPAFQPKTSPLRLETWVALAGTEGEPPSSRFRFVVEVLSEPADLPAEVALYESLIWLISGSLGVAGLSLMLVGLSFLRRLHGTAARQAAHGMLTTKITRALSADLDPDRLFRNILQEIRQVVPCDRIVIAGVDPATREHRFWHVESDFSVPRFSGEGNREVGEWNLKHVYARMLPTNFPDLEKVDAPWVPYLLKGGLRSVFLMPILQEGEYFAHLGLSWARKGGVDPGSEALLSSLAGHLASAIRNATLFQRAERRASRLATLNALSQKIAQNIDLRETLDAIVQAAVELLGGDIARAFLLDEETGVLVPQAHAGRIPPPSAPLGTLRVGRGVIGRIVESGEPAILPDVQEVPEWQLNDWARENGLHAYVAHPLRLGGKPFGAIYCISTKAGFFTREDLDLLGSFSFQASIAIEKARLFAETRQRALRLELAGEITKALASTLRPGELFRTIAREIRRAVPCERCVIGSLDRESHRYHTWHAESEVELPVRDQAFDDEGTWWDRDVYESMRMVGIPDIRPISYRRAQEMADAGLRSVLVMPILQDGKSAAHIFLASVRPANFTRDHERLLASLSDHLGMALRNAMLYQASEDKTSRLEITGEIAKAVSSSLEPEEIFRTITREIRRAIPCERCAISTVDPQTAIPAYWHIDSDIEVEPLPPGQGMEAGGQLLEKVYARKEPYCIHDIL